MIARLVGICQHPPCLNISMGGDVYLIQPLDLAALLWRAGVGT